MRMRLAPILLVVAGLGCLISWRHGAGRRLWYPAYRALAGARSHADVLSEIGPIHRPGLEESVAAVGLSYPPIRLTLVGLKAERRLEVWAGADSGWVLLRSYPVLAASGGPGPKRRQGDRQVPEGVYRLTGFNPNSSYHLSIRVDYPNEDDREAARAEGRANLGGDIFIHGKAVSIGCLAIGDPAIEELYVLLADVGLARSTLLLSPSAVPVSSPEAPEWVIDRYRRLAGRLDAVRGREDPATPTGDDRSLDRERR